MDKITYKRDCPKCRNSITYARIYDCVNAENKNTVCKSCANGDICKNNAIKSRKYKGKNIWENEDTAILYLKEIAVDNRVPGYMSMFRKFGKLFSERIKLYGGYKQLARDANLEIKNLYKSKDGHILSSYYELLFDEYLALNNIPHETEGFICNFNKCRYDFKIGDVYVEIWGINSEGNKHYKYYCEKRKKKEQLYKELGLKFIAIEGKDFQKSSEDLQTLFKNKLLEFGIQSSDKQILYPVFNRRKIGYWNEEIVIKELKIIIEEIGGFPTFNQLKKMNRNDLAGVTTVFGGYRKFAKLLEYEPQTKEFSEQYVLDELKYIKGKIGHFPCDRELQEIGRSNLAGMIKSHGGYGYFKELIEGKRDKKPFGYWNNEDNIMNELKLLMKKLGRFPSYNELGVIAKGIDKSKKGMKYYEKLLVK
jgi:hypothetical protein